MKRKRKNKEQLINKHLLICWILTTLFLIGLKLTTNLPLTWGLVFWTPIYVGVMGVLILFGFALLTVSLINLMDGLIERLDREVN